MNCLSLRELRGGCAPASPGAYPPATRTRSLPQSAGSDGRPAGSRRATIETSISVIHSPFSPHVHTLKTPYIAWIRVAEDELKHQMPAVPSCRLSRCLRRRTTFTSVPPTRSCSQVWISIPGVGLIVVYPLVPGSISWPVPQVVSLHERLRAMFAKPSPSFGLFSILLTPRPYPGSGNISIVRMLSLLFARVTSRWS